MHIGPTKIKSVKFGQWLETEDMLEKGTFFFHRIGQLMPPESDVKRHYRAEIITIILYETSDVLSQFWLAVAAYLYIHSVKQKTIAEEFFPR